MGEAENRQTVLTVFRAILEGDVGLFHRQFCEDSVIEFPQSGERIVGGANRRAVYRSFPGRPSVTRTTVGGDLAVVEATVDYGDAADWRAVFIYRLRGARIATAAAYWAQPFQPAESRAAWVEPIDS